MNYKSGYGIKKMIVISMLSGILSLLFSNFGIEARVGEIDISIPWSLIFPIITAIAFGSRFGIIAGLAGGAYFPFLLWPNNGIPNATTALVYLVVYSLLGLLHNKSFLVKQKKESVRIMIILAICITIFAFYFSLLFNPLLSFNPLLGLTNAINGLPVDVRYSFIIKNSINLILLTFVARTLLELAWVRKALGMKFVPASKSNNTILTYSISVSVIVWLLLYGLGHSLLYGDNAFKSQQLSLVLFVILAAGFVVAKVLFQYNESKLNIEIELKEREDRLKTIIATSPDGLAITDLNGTPQYLSPQCLKMWGYNNPEEVIGRNVMEFVHPDYHQKAIHNITEMMNGNLTGPAEYLMLKKDGTTFYAEANANVLHDADNNPTGILYFERDITQRKQEEENRRENEEEHRMLLQTAMDGFWLVDLEGRLKEVNKTYCQMSGYSEQELLLMRIADFEVIGQGNDTAKRIQKLIKKGEDRFETQHRRKDGSILDVEIGVQYRSAKDGQIVAFIKDITESKRIEAVLQESEIRFKILYENAPLSYQSLDQNACLIDVNPTWLATLGYKYDEVIGRHFGDFMTPESAEMIQKRFPSFIAAGEIHDYQFEMIRKDGSHFIVSYEGKIGYDELGNFKQTHCIFTDITQRQQAQEDLNKLAEELEVRVIKRTEQLELANKELESFSYSVSHDLRTPLRALDGFANILLEDYAPLLDSEGKRMLNIIIANANRMGYLIDDLLAFSRLGRQEMQNTHVDMHQMANSAYRELVNDEDTIEFRLHPIPETMGDPALLRQVWMNFIGNSIKFSANKPNRIIEIGTLPSATEIIYFIKDNGAGFNMDYSNKLFAVFQRLHSHKEFEGTGIGLSIVQRIIQRHSGRVWAEGKEDEGATFYFALPGKSD